jgi:hypothetical protein
MVDMPSHNIRPVAPIVKPSQAENEDKILRHFRAKRANVFSEGIDDNERSTYRPKRIAKTPKQAQTIR